MKKTVKMKGVQTERADNGNHAHSFAQSASFLFTAV